MTSAISSLLRRYVANYAGVPFECWQGILLTFINAVSIGISFFLSIYFVYELHVNILTSGFLISLYGGGTVLGGIISGRLSDLISPKIISTVSLLLQSLAFLLLTKLHVGIWLMGNLFALGMATYGFKTANNVWTLNHCAQVAAMRLKTINISHAASNFGLGISGILIGACISYGFKNIFYLSSFLLLLASLYLIFRGFEKPPSSPFLDEVKNHQERHSHRVVILIFACVFAIGLIIAQLGSTYPIYIQEAFPTLGTRAVSILFVLDTLLIVLFQAPLVNLLNGYNKVLIVGTGAFLMGFGMLVLSVANHFFMGICSCLIWTTGEMLFISMAQLICYEKSSHRYKGLALGSFQTIFATSTVIGPTVGGYIYHHAGGDLLWYLSGVIGTLCLFFCFLFRNYD